MELSHSLTLNEDALSKLPESQKPVFVVEWLRYLSKVLVALQKSDLKECQEQLIAQLMKQIHESPGPPARKLIARCLATLFTVGDTFSLFDSISKLNDILRSKDDSPSFLPTKLAAGACLGAMFEKLGRMMGRSYEETVQILVRSLKNAESLHRITIMSTLEKLCIGMGSAAGSFQKDIYKAAKNCLTDRSMPVRRAAVRCLTQMVPLAPFLYTTELESMCTLCFRAMDGSNYQVRCSLAELVGALLSMTQQPAKPNGGAPVQTRVEKTKTCSLDEAMGILVTGFQRTNVSSVGVIKPGSSSVPSREVRVGVAHAFVAFADTLGPLWLERNMQGFLSHVFELVACGKNMGSTHVEAVYARKCVGFILHSTLGKMLGEKAQLAACKELILVMRKQVNTKEAGDASLANPHILVCALVELGVLVSSLGTCSNSLLTDASLGLLEMIYGFILSSTPAAAVRYASAWCLACIGRAVPSQLTMLIDTCTDKLEKTGSSSPEGVSGFACAISALVAAAQHTPLGIPHTRGKLLFNVAEELLRSANQNPRLSLPRTHGGWMMIGAIMTLGMPVVKSLLPRMLLLWRNSFPRSPKELESEKARGDAFTWQVTLEGRSGALAAMHSFVLHCPQLALEHDTVRRILAPVESALGMLANIQGVVKSYSQHLKASAAMVRLRLNQVLALIPPRCYESSFTHLLRLLVSEFTLSENPANTTTSLLRPLCHSTNPIILGSWLQDTDHRHVEDQLQSTSASGSSAIEHDPSCLYLPLPDGEYTPGALPLGVGVVDSAVILFGHVFPHCSPKHKGQLIDHFAECLKQAKAQRQEAITINIFAGLLLALRNLADTKTPLPNEDVCKGIVSLISSNLTNSNTLVRCAAGEALGRLAQVIGDSKFVAEMAQESFEKLRCARDVASRTGHSLALGALHFYVGGMGSSQHLNTSVSILLALAQDVTSPVVQVWALHALALIADSGGPMFRGFVEPTLSLCLKLLLTVSPAHVDVHHCVGRVLSGLITTIGPELQGNTSALNAARWSFLCACAVMQDSDDALVEAEATSCLQQLHMFAPRHVNLTSLVPSLCRNLTSKHLLLRKAAVSCLRQLAQREAKEVCSYAASLSSQDRDNGEGLMMGESGLPGVLVSMLDTETDAGLVRDVKECLYSMLQSLGEQNLQFWLRLCKEVLTVASDTTNEEQANGDEDEEEGDELGAGIQMEDLILASPRWPTRVFAAQCVRRLICVTAESKNPAHFDLGVARERLISHGNGDFMVLHLSDLVRMGFIAATGDCDPLRLEGLQLMQVIIDKFSQVPEPEFPGHFLLEQYQAQVGAALRPAFAPETPSHVTAMACQVCNAWIRGSGVSGDLNDLRRVHHLLVSSLTKLKKPTSQTQTQQGFIYNESAMTLEKLAILKAWAEVYVAAMKGRKEEQITRKMTLSECESQETDGLDSEQTSGTEGKGGNLLSLVEPELVNLSKHWLAALKDYALLSLPPEFAGQLPHDGGAFFTHQTTEEARVHYEESWRPILHAAAMWLNDGGFENVHLERSDVDISDSDNLGLGAANAAATKSPESINTDRFHLIFGICLRALCMSQASDPAENICICLEAMNCLLDSTWARGRLTKDIKLAIELCNVMHRILLTRDVITVQVLVFQVVDQVVAASRERLDALKRLKMKGLAPANQEPKNVPECDLLGDGGEAGEIIPGESIVYALLEVCLCVLVRHLPSLHPSLPPSLAAIPMKNERVNDPTGQLKNSLIAQAVNVLQSLPQLASPKGSSKILATVLYLVTGVLKEVSVEKPGEPKSAEITSNSAVQACLKCLKMLASDRYACDERSAPVWVPLLQSALLRILDFTKTGADESLKVNQVVMMMAVAMFILHAPNIVLCAPNLQYPCINMFRLLVHHEDLAMRLRCVQTIESIFQRQNRSVTAPYIHALAPRIVEYLFSEETMSLMTQAEFLVVKECLKTVVLLLSVCDDGTREELLGLVAPAFVRFLLTDASAEMNEWRKALHRESLDQLMKIGPTYPTEFRAVMAKAPHLRTRLEASIRAEKEKAADAKQRSSENADAAAAAAAAQPSAPSIKLKMDFSNFRT